ncbi:MAG: hypothetical protein GW772_02865 [Flavobacteriia bacterium]|nr:hypothetical protein [Flavobacteriia bacterium]OIP48273.1 MAG: hypothetical protein AUK46_02405 [Flavobacteriaceae bacterium CG2_30_31_66]PIV97744.1 MAG: hypothetical protein COW43_01500 [Flavobacteriaceae bacterium CG17_big_fil_post_rev_8_21_14_2_50_31_13]PIX12544.1 MAG: hypothetical protein COZ74_10960 [Flavobacteriaceae bacterium CG_4_8_14_3_um_filter_31_8]PIY14482.1 MAG: hypothetical protein COZ16_09280 [Flavobacteriaceae bacterium CG_4_10_14_3_um_filter_31_253]PIZ10069.1 MAG: hypotheti
MGFNKYSEFLYKKLLSDETRKKLEKIILIISITSFFVHLMIIFLVDFGFIALDEYSDLLTNPIAAIYTPFSFILIYEVYLLIYYLPKSFTIYISKQYEIIALIVIRRIFKDLSSLTLSSDWFTIKYDLQFTYDIVASLILFFLIYQFFIQSKKRYNFVDDEPKNNGIERFIKFKQILATLLVPVIVCVTIYSFVNWFSSSISENPETTISFKNINNVFFEQFFTILIITDVILLLFSFFHTDEFHKVFRNSGFIISTILLRISFSVSGLLNTVLIIAAISFGLIILILYNKFEQNIALEKLKKVN